MIERKKERKKERKRERKKERKKRKKERKNKISKIWLLVIRKYCKGNCAGEWVRKRQKTSNEGEVKQTDQNYRR
jgi:hypothetical protein